MGTVRGCEGRWPWGEQGDMRGRWGEMALGKVRGHKGDVRGDGTGESEGTWGEMAPRGAGRGEPQRKEK